MGICSSKSKQDDSAQQGPLFVNSTNTAPSSRAFDNTQSVVIVQDPRQDKTGKGRERLANVFVKPLENTENFEFPVHEKTDAEMAIIKKAVHENFIFKDLEQEQCQTLLKAFEKYSARAKDIIITEGETGDYFYVVASGHVSFSIGQRDVTTKTRIPGRPTLENDHKE